MHAFCLHNTTAIAKKAEGLANFFKNQQFITRSVRADRGSYFVTTLNRTRGKEKGKGKRKEKVYIKRNY